MGQKFLRRHFARHHLYEIFHFFYHAAYTFVSEKYVIIANNIFQDKKTYFSDYVREGYQISENS